MRGVPSGWTGKTERHGRSARICPRTHWSEPAGRIWLRRLFATCLQPHVVHRVDVTIYANHAMAAGPQAVSSLVWFSGHDLGLWPNHLALRGEPSVEGLNIYDSADNPGDFCSNSHQASSKNSETGMAMYSLSSDSLSLDSMIAFLCPVCRLKLIRPSKSLADILLWNFTSIGVSVPAASL